MGRRISIRWGPEAVIARMTSGMAAQIRRACSRLSIPIVQVDLKIACQYSQHIPKGPEGIAWAGLRIALTAGHQQIGVSGLRNVCELAHQSGFSTPCISKQEYRHGIAGQGLMQAALQAGQFLATFYKIPFQEIRTALILLQESRDAQQ